MYALPDGWKQSCPPSALGSDKQAKIEGEETQEIVVIFLLLAWARQKKNINRHYFKLSQTKALFQPE